MAKAITSKEYKLIKNDFVKWFDNQRVFIIPALIVFLTSIQQGSDVKEALIAVYVWALSAALDLLRKYKNETRY